MKPQPKRKVVVIALSEAAPDLVFPWIEAGHLPNLAGFMTTGAHGRIRSHVPFIRPQTWGTVVTGLPARIHGLFDFWQRGKDHRFHITDAKSMRADPIWRDFGQQGLSCGIVNTPFSYPPDPVNGFMLSGEDSPGVSKETVYPQDLYGEICRQFGSYRPKAIFPGGRDKSDYLGLVEEAVGHQADVMEYLLKEKDPDFYLAFFVTTGVVQHYFWADMESADPENPYRDVILRAYVALDKAIGRIANAAGPNAQIFVISECGAGPMISGIQINAWLSGEGFLAYRPVAGKAKQSGDAQSLHATWPQRAVARLRRSYQRLPESVKFWAHTKLDWVFNGIQRFVSDNDIDWTRTKAFAAGKEGTIYINLKGRDPHGIVEPGAEYQSVCQDIKERLERLIDPNTGQPAVDGVHLADEIYDGPHKSFAPDIVIEWRDTAYMPTEVAHDRQSVFVPRYRAGMAWPTSGSHRVEGIFFAAGPEIAPARQIDNATIYDLAPTWYSCFGLEPKPEFQGRILHEIFTKESPGEKADA